MSGDTERDPLIVRRPTGEGYILTGVGLIVLGLVLILFGVMGMGDVQSAALVWWLSVGGAALVQLGLVMWVVGEIQKALWFLPGDEEKRSSP